jgi:hypothetical protein
MDINNFIKDLDFYKDFEVSHFENNTCSNIENVINNQLKNKGYNINENNIIGYETKNMLLERIEDMKKISKDD